jgi:hypothetical protein
VSTVNEEATGCSAANFYGCYPMKKCLTSACIAKGVVVLAERGV